MSKRRMMMKRRDKDGAAETTAASAARAGQLLPPPPRSVGGWVGMGAGARGWQAAADPTDCAARCPPGASGRGAARPPARRGTPGRADAQLGNTTHERLGDRASEGEGGYRRRRRGRVRRGTWPAARRPPCPPCMGCARRRPVCGPGLWPGRICLFVFYYYYYHPADRQQGGWLWRGQRRLCLAVLRCG